jgi:hypothetical protein
MNSTASILDYYDDIMQACVPAFAQRRTHGLWASLLVGWLLTVTHRTLTGMLLLADPEGRHPHDAYHRLLRIGAWSLSQVYRVLATRLVATFPLEAVIPLVADDTLAHHVGPKVAGAGWYRDPVRSTGTTTVHAHGVSLVILAVNIRPPWGGPPLALPIAMRVHRKDGDATYVDLLIAMLREVRAWFPGRHFTLMVDGAYASIAAEADDTLSVTSRLRRDARVFDLPQQNPPRKRGPKPKKGTRLPSPQEMAADPATSWESVTVRRGTRTLTRLVHTRQVIWQAVRPNHPVRAVFVRDPDGREADDYFFTTARDATAETTVTDYGERWPIEVTIRDSKQLLGLQEPQCWREDGPERAAGLGLWLYSLVWHIYLTAQPTTPVDTAPWYQHKRAPSFADALAAVRSALWARKIGTLDATRGPEAISRLLIACLAHAA